MKRVAYEMRVPSEPLVRVEKDLPPPGRGEATVAVAGCGVCHTDLGFLFEGVPTRRPLPLVLGHEIAGTIAAVGPDVGLKPGTPVVVPAVLPCGACALCRRGRGDVCRAQIFPGNDVDGGFATHATVPARGLCEIRGAERPAGRNLARLAVCADAASTAYAAVRRAEIAPGDFAIFVGAGGVGGFGVQFARAAGARTLAIDVSRERLDLLAANGAERTLDATGMDPKAVKAAVRELAKGASVDPACWRIFETSGTAAGQATAFALLGPAAALMVVGFHPGDVSVRLSNLMAFAARAEGVWGCPPELFPDVLELVTSGRIAVDPFVEFHPLSAINVVLGRVRRREITRRPILLPDEETR